MSAPAESPEKPRGFKIRDTAAKESAFREKNGLSWAFAMVHILKRWSGMPLCGELLARAKGVEWRL